MYTTPAAGDGRRRRSREAAEGGELPDRPNVLMIVVDCLRADRVFGANRSCRTPNVDALVARGAVAPNMFVENSITSPAFASLFTGCSSLRHGVTSLLGVQLNPDLTTLADLFAANGYRTHAEVTGPLMPQIGLSQGFDEYHYRDQRECFFCGWGESLIARLKRKGFAAPWFLLVHFWELHEPRQVAPEFAGGEWGATTYDRSWSGLDSYLGRLLNAAGPDTAVILTGDHGERLTERIEPASLLPYFMHKLRIPMLQKEEDTRVGEDVELMNRQSGRLHDVAVDLAQQTAGGGRLGVAKRLAVLLRLGRVALTRMRTQKRRPGWRGLTEWLRLKWDDMHVAWAVARGDSRDAQLHLLRTTLSQFHLQHGFHVYDYLARVPFIVAGLPGLAAGRTDAAVRNLDVLPTLVEALGLATPTPDWHGVSFWPQLHDGGAAERPLYMEARGGAQATHAFYVRGVRRDGWKLAYAPHDSRAPAELYDLRADPAETRNLFAANPETAAALRAECEALAAAWSAAGDGAAMSAADRAAMVEKLKSLGYM
jgi:arylsulfatase A-like enzyme